METYQQTPERQTNLYFYDVTYKHNGRPQRKKGEMAGSSADAVILVLLDQYPRCTGRVGRKHDEK
ncbi:hypothetical protein F965_00040 [Acinetobacter schindleri NIPH 900]|uniref:Uncharacterized protein n=1 Tax=Acinetobacter schindleri NIPH 900 TaxID=1217675 RepID=N8Y046_9GAMM|nr:hypothetical protein [Acinetobacter schindleri]ENV14694.1 hypothetical protein F965_00040 [Acinetobacter schindleri NIPH 900]